MERQTVLDLISI